VPQAEVYHVFLTLKPTCTCARVGQNHIYIYDVYARYFLAGNSPNIRTCSVHIHGSG